MEFKSEIAAPLDGPKTRTTSPMTTGTTVLACKYRDGVLMLADTLGSYGSLARFPDLRRIREINKTTMVGASGDYSDFQWLMKLLEEITIMDFEEDDGRTLTASEIHSFLSRVMYNKRSKVDPCWNHVITAGVEEKKTFLGCVDLYGSTYEDNYVATGFGTYLAVPILAQEWKADMSEAEAKALLEKAMTVCFYRDCRALNKYTIASVTKDGVKVSEPYSLPTQWTFKLFVDVNSKN